jgi:hypothetical protein
MSITTRASMARSVKLPHKQKDDRATRHLNFRISPDLVAVSAFAAIGLLLTGCMALAFPEWSGAFVW